LESGVNKNMRDNYGMTAVMYATRTCNLKLLKLLIDYGADVNIHDNYGDFPILFVFDFDHFGNRMLELLVSAGADINVQNDNGNTLLMRAAIQYDYKAMKKLLEYDNININLRNRRGQTVYDLADDIGKKIITDYLNKKKLLTFMNSGKLPKELYPTLGKFLVFGTNKKRSRKKSKKRKYLLV
jgi:uncharacterized protein